MFALTKVAWFLATPSNLLALGALLGALAARRIWGRGLCLLCLGAAVLLGLSPAGFWLLLPLEDRFPAYREADAAVAGIVVLGGAVQPDTSAARGQLATGDAAERMIAMADLARRHPAARIVFSGGSGALVKGGVPEAEAVRLHGAALGIDVGRILFEDRSRTTAENAREVRRLVAPGAGERWLLVTSAWHMPRAVGAFRQAGFAVVPYPVDYRTGAPGDLVAGTTSVASGLNRVDLAVREWAGLLAYRLSGRSEAVLPAPSSGGPIR